MKTAILALIPAAALLLVSCGKQATQPAVSVTPEGPAAAKPEVPASLMLDAPPATEVVTIGALKADAKPGDEVAVKVVVGGRVKPVVDSLAVMTVVDGALPNACTTEDDHCKTPWDYCCAGPEELTAAMATIRIVGDDGKPLALNLADANVKPGDTIIVAGTVSEKNEAGNLVIDAQGIHKP
jgi:hypothetical protein